MALLKNFTRTNRPMIVNRNTVLLVSVNTRKKTDISYRIIEGKSTESPILMAHGLLGHKHNFQTAAKIIGQRTHRSVITFDARNHGQSGHSDEMCYRTMSDDALQLLDDLGVARCIFLGHSMGGKTAIYAALNHPDRVDKLVSVDSPVRPSWQVGSSTPYLVAMQKVNFDEPFRSLSYARRSADEQMKRDIKDDVIRQFVVSNVVQHEPGVFGWRCNLDALLPFTKDRSLSVIGDRSKPFERDALFLCGGKSRFVTGADFFLIRRCFPNAVISHIPGCGHWVHSEKPVEFIERLFGFLYPHSKVLLNASS